MADSRDFRLGSIWLVSFDPSCGTEIQKTRPALVVSGTEYNQQRSKITVLPFTSLQLSDRRVSPVTVIVSPSSQNGLDRESLLICIDIMTFDKGRFIRYLGQLENELLEQAKNIICRYLNLEKPNPKIIISSQNYINVFPNSYQNMTRRCPHIKEKKSA